MANELGPIHEPTKAIVFNPASAFQIRQMTGLGSPQWVAITSAVFAECAITLAQQGTTGSYWADLPAGLDTTRVYPILLYATSATAFSDPASEAVYRPEGLTTQAKADVRQQASDELAARGITSSWSADVDGQATSAATNALVAANASTNAAADTVTLKARLGAITGAGVNTVLGYFRAMMSKGATVPSDIGGTFDPATDSVEAIKDAGVPSTGGGGLTTPQDQKLTQISNAIQTLQKK